jgi:toxin YoeB
MPRELTLKDRAVDHLQYWLLNDRRLLDRIIRLMKECQRTPFEGTGKPEPLKSNMSGLWSRRINDEHRLIYKVTDDAIIVQSMRGHYE